MLNRKEKKLEQDIRSFLLAEEPPSIDRERREQTLELLRVQRKRLRLMAGKSYAKRLLDQAAYISPGAWLGQGGLLLLLGFIFQIPGWETGDIMVSLTACAPLFGMICFTEVMRSYQRDMWELEKSCRYNLKQVAGMRLLIFGLVDFVILAAVFAGGIRLGVSADSLLMFFVVPVILSDSMYLCLMERFRKGFWGILPAAFGIIMDVMWLILSAQIWENPRLVRLLLQPVTLAAVLLGSLGILAWCCTRFLQETSGGCEARYNE